MAVRFRTLSSMKEITAPAWDALANPAGASFNPFVSYAFLHALEESGSATARTGWAPTHLVMEEDGEITGLVPCYLKSHSQGEYVFDYGWADAFHRAGGSYYPKLQISVPFTPVTGPRLLASTAERRRLLLQGVQSLASKLQASSAHVTFLPEHDWREPAEPWLQRQDIQFHWKNHGYGSFDDFLASLSSAKRKNIRKERKTVAEAGVSFQHVTGRDLAEKHWDAFFAFYMDTGSRKWGRPYLTRKFFSMVGEALRDHILLVLAERSGKIIAGALNFLGSDTLYGRNWGCLEDHPFLHFETCYYQAIEFAIAHRLTVVEAGAQGEHKLARGYLPVKTYSLHYLAHPGLSRAVAQYLARERDAVDENQSLLAAHSPFRQIERE